MYESKMKRTSDTHQAHMKRTRGVENRCVTCWCEQVAIRILIKPMTPRLGRLLLLDWYSLFAAKV